MNSTFLSLAFRNVFRNRTRSIITLLVISTGCISMIIARGFLDDDVHQVQEICIRDSLGHLRIYKKGYLEEGVLHPFDYLITQPAALEAQIVGIPHVLSTSPRLTVAGLVSNGDTSLTFIGEAMDPAKETAMRTNTLITQGAFLEPNEPYGVMLGKGLAKALLVKPGQSLVLVVSTKGGGVNATDVALKGVFGTIDRSFDDHAIRLPLQLAQKLLRTDGIEMLLVHLDRMDEVATVQKQLQSLFASQQLPYEVKAWHELDEADDIKRLADIWAQMFSVFKIIILSGVFLGIVNTMNMVVLERVGEIGTLMAIGMKRSGITQLFMVEGLILGILGSIIGCVLGILLSLGISWIGIPMPPPPGSNIPWIGRIELSPEIFVLPFFLSVITALISAIFPALKAARLEVAEALRHNV